MTLEALFTDCIVFIFFRIKIEKIFLWKIGILLSPFSSFLGSYFISEYS